MAKSKNSLQSKVVRVILLARVRNLGKRGDAPLVKKGYMRNFLQKQNLAMPFSDQAQEEIAGSLGIPPEKLAEDELIARKLHNTHLLFERQATTAGVLFSSVTKKHIAEAVLKLHDVQLDAKKISINAPIKTSGTYTIHAQAGEIPFEMLVAVAKTLGEAKELIKEHHDNV